MSLLSQLPAPKHTSGAPSRWEQPDLDVVPVTRPELSTMGKKDDVKSEFWQVVPKGPQVAAAAHPDADAVRETAAATMQALSAVVDKKMVAANPTAVSQQARPSAATYIKYTPKTANPHHNSGVDHRIIQMQDLPVDPLEPPKFRHQKVPRVPDSTPVPVLHSPPRALTKEDQANWRIPPCVSAWKNNKGYTIPLDKRLAADGRGMQETTINKRHMDLAQSLYAAEEAARKETEMQARLQAEVKSRQKAKKEEELRRLAAEARAGGAAAGAAAPVGLAARLDDAAAASAAPSGVAASDLPPPVAVGGGGGAAGEERLTREEREAKRARDELRRERAREREREMRLEAKERAGGKRSKLTRDRDRDISEAVALGQADVRGGGATYDSRLFGREAGLASGFKGEDNYAVYDKELFADRSAMGLYRARDVRDAEMYGGGGGADGDGGAGGREVDTGRFRPDRGFEGTDGGAPGARTGPVQFERQTEADPFGIEGFLGGVGRK